MIPMTAVTRESLGSFVIDVLQALGLPREDAEIFGGALLFSELRFQSGSRAGREAPPALSGANHRGSRGRGCSARDGEGEPRPGLDGCPQWDRDRRGHARHAGRCGEGEGLRHRSGHCLQLDALRL